jgi:hypothetical protein
MNRILTFCIAVAAGLVLVTTASATSRQHPAQVAAQWAQFHRLLNPPAVQPTFAATFSHYHRLLNAPAPQTDTGAVPPLRGYRDFGLAFATPAERPLVSETMSSVPQVRGYGDFGLPIAQPEIVPNSVVTPASQPLDEISASGFDWADAGAGAAATLGLVVIVGALGAGLVMTRRHHRQIST